MLRLRTDLDSYTQADLQRDLLLLPQWRREQALRFKHFRGQMECTLSYLLLLETLNHYGTTMEPLLNNHGTTIERSFAPLNAPTAHGTTIAPRFSYNAHGKPYLAEFPDIHFNLSHCHNAIACVVDSKPVGVDVEDMGRYRESLARYCMNDSEMNSILGAADPDLEFTRLWTRKEAVYKLSGTGIKDDIRGCLEHLEGINIETTIHDKFILSIAKQF